MRTPNFQVTMAGEKKARVEVYDDIGPSFLGMIDAKLVSSELKKAGDVKQIEVRINSRGGSAWEGLAIANLLKDHPAQVEVVIDGIAASAASLIAMAGDKIRMPKSALMMIHDPMVMVYGGEEELKTALEMLDTTKRAGVELYAAKSKKTADEIAKLMKIETWYTGDEAVAAGFADVTDKEIKVEVKNAAPVVQWFKNAPQLAYALLARPVADAPPEVANPDSVGQTIPPHTENDMEVNEVSQLKAKVAELEAQAVAAKSAAESGEKRVLAEERSRCENILALCQKVGQIELAAEYVKAGLPLADVQAKMIDVLASANKPIDKSGSEGSGDAPPKAGENAKYEAEFKANLHFAKVGMSLEDYVATRRIDDGLDSLTPKAK